MAEVNTETIKNIPNVAARAARGYVRAWTRLIKLTEQELAKAKRADTKSNLKSAIAYYKSKRAFWESPQPLNAAWRQKASIESIDDPRVELQKITRARTQFLKSKDVSFTDRRIGQIQKQLYSEIQKRKIGRTAVTAREKQLRKELADLGGVYKEETSLAAPSFLGELTNIFMPKKKEKKKTTTTTTTQETNK